MDAIGNMQPVAIALPILPTHVSTGSTPMITVPNSTPEALPAHTTALPAHFDARAAEQKHQEAVQQKAQDIANTHILGDSEFTIFKDNSGQLITRFRNKLNGNVTYIPQPELFKMGGSSGSDALPLLKITA